jgi:DNA-binding NtrC family response regulator
MAKVRRLFTPRVQREGQPIEPSRWWEVEFFPLRQGSSREGCLLLGRVLPLTIETDSSANAQAMLPERLEMLRLRRLGRFGIELLDSVHVAFKRLAEQVRLASQVRVPVLLFGEPGTGKETIARIIHRLSPGQESAFAALDCRLLPTSAVSDVLLAERTSPLWRGLGAIYLADPECLPRELQVRLCEWLSRQGEATTNPRLFVAFRSDPAQSVQQGQLLEELHWRVSSLMLAVPPLRVRIGDLPYLVQRFLNEGEKENNAPILRVSEAAREALQKHTWPRNLTELREVLHTARRHAKDGLIELTDLPFAFRQAGHAETKGQQSLPLEETLAEVERRLIQVALKRTRGNRSQAAELLGIHRPRLLRRMEALGITEKTSANEERE